MSKSSNKQVDVSTLLRVVALLFAVLLIVIAIAVALVRWWNMQPGTAPLAPQVEQNLPAHLETAPQPALARYLREKNQLIESYAWIDQSTGLARIPLELAMRALAERPDAAIGGRP